MKPMWKRICFIGLLCLLSLSSIRCHTNRYNQTGDEKMSANDPFKTTVTKSEFFTINTNADTVIEGKQGTRIVLPAHCFKNQDGKTVEGDVKFELAEALDLENMIFSNLTATSNGKPLVTEGMLYISATSGSEKLHIDSTKPVYIEVPTRNRQPGMMAYKGIRDEKGNMNWINPKPIDNYLVSVDLASLDFLPQGFAAEVAKGMPFRNHKTATQELTDSLYYSLSVDKNNDTTGGVNPMAINEAYYNKHKRIVNGKYTSDSYNYGTNPIGEDAASSRHDIRRDTRYGIDPAAIKTIRGKKFQNTLISTREFETRLQYIFKSGDNKVLDLYTHNLDKNMWEIDSMAANIVQQSACGCKDTTPEDLKQKFREFAAQKLTRVQGETPNARKMAAYFERKLKAIKARLEQLQEKEDRAVEKQNKKAEEVENAYKDLLWQREKYRMEKYDFQWTETGWINVDNGTIPKTWYAKDLNVTVDNKDSCSRVYTYVVYTTIKSLYRLNSDDNQHFYVGNDEDKVMDMPKNADAVLVAIGYKNDMPYFDVLQFNTAQRSNLALHLKPSNDKEIKAYIRQFKSYETENKIDVDLAYQAFFAKEEAHQKRLIAESKFMERLRETAMPCGKSETVWEEE